MTRLRICATVLAGAFLMSATACGSGDDATPTAAADAPAATTAAAPAATTPAADAAGGDASDKELCETAKKAETEMRQKLMSAISTGEEPEPSLYGEIYTGMADSLKTAGEGAVADAMNGFAAEATKAAAAANPGEAADNPGMEKAGRELTAACKAAGVTVNF